MHDIGSRKLEKLYMTSCREVQIMKSITMCCRPQCFLPMKALDIHNKAFREFSEVNISSRP